MSKVREKIKKRLGLSYEDIRGMYVEIDNTQDREGQLRKEKEIKEMEYTEEAEIILSIVGMFLLVGVILIGLVSVAALYTRVVEGVGMNKWDYIRLLILTMMVIVTIGAVKDLSKRDKELEKMLEGIEKEEQKIQRKKVQKERKRRKKR